MFRNICVYVLILLVCFLVACTKTEVVNGPTSAGSDITSGLVLYLPLNGHVADSSGNRFSGIAQSLSYGADRFGKDSGAARFQTAGSYVMLGDILDTVFCKPVGRFTICGWANATVTGSWSYGGGTMIGKSAGGNTGPYEFSVTHVNNLVVADLFFDTLAANYVRLSAPMGTQTWFHFAVVFDGSLPEADRAILYINGLNLATTTRRVTGLMGAGICNSSQRLMLAATHGAGNTSITGNYFLGSMSDVRIYNRPLTSGQIAAVYLAE